MIMNTYLLNWKDGSKTEIQGKDLADAFRKTGAVVPNLDYWEELREANVKQWSVDPEKFKQLKETVRKVC